MCIDLTMAKLSSSSQWLSSYPTIQNLSCRESSGNKDEGGECDDEMTEVTRIWWPWKLRLADDQSTGAEGESSTWEKRMSLEIKMRHLEMVMSLKNKCNAKGSSLGEIYQR
jgi:hypothetical protein